MPDRLSATVIAVAAALAAAAFGGAYALGHGESAPAPDPRAPTAIAVGSDPLVGLGPARPLPRLVQPPVPRPVVAPDTEDLASDEEADAIEPAAPAPTPAPAPAPPTPTPAPTPAPAPTPDPAPPANFDDSG